MHRLYLHFYISKLILYKNKNCNHFVYRYIIHSFGINVARQEGKQRIAKSSAT